MITIKKKISGKPPNTRHAAFILLSLLALVTGCAGMNAMPAPPRVDTLIEIAERPSTIALPVSFDVSRIDSKINNAVPERLIAVDENNHEDAALHFQTLAEWDPEIDTVQQASLATDEAILDMRAERAELGIGCR